ncbi:P-loop containing nucleoside triphosphate hydrolase protein [Absidia repens]|uniref:p-loop containing nucleoside triphosphate hydrolase protein n=1 Tax=Absidia repens TaxID=90262 RepID=A0A1X2IN52_9FUNG|nr:P-loop containing nucleoside triphosphate hydrolase protein [Absidia repens]
MTNRNICLGMIKSDVVTKDPLFLTKDDLFEPVLMQLEGLRQNNYSFTISSKKDPRKFYGWVPFDDTSILGPMAAKHLVWWDTVIPRSKANPTRTPLYIILYCRSNVYHILCQYLSSRKLDLQDPPFFNPTCRYNNPKFSKQFITSTMSSSQSTSLSYSSSQNLHMKDGCGSSSYRTLPFATASSTISTPPADNSNAYSEQTKRGIAQLLDNIPASIRRPNSTTSRGGSSEASTDSDQLKQRGLTEEDLHMEGLTITLLPHQVEGIRWMKDREDNEYSSGGILADVSYMGLGKTIQTIGLVSSTLDVTNKRQKTLIVAPLALIQQWASEFDTKTTPGSIKLLIHHGSDRTKDSKDFDDYDVVVTTYQIVASDLAATSGAGKKRGRRRQRQQQQSTTGDEGSTPLELMDEDMGSGSGIFESDTSAASSRVPSPNGNGQPQDDGVKPVPVQSDGPLFQVSWHRVVLDEAQQIKNHVTRSSTACSKLISNKRWCLTGTPIQNRVDELYSLLRFLRIPSFSDMATFRRTISGPMQMGKVDVALERLKALLMAIMLRRTKQILSSPSGVTTASAGTVTPASSTDPPPQQSSSLSSTTTTPTTSGFSTPTESSSLSSTLVLGLPPREKHDVILEFTENERALYDVLTKKTSAAVEKLVKAGKSTGNYMNMICLVLRLRQACNHPQLVLRSLSSDEDILALASENSLAQQQAAKRESSEAAMQRMVMAQMAADLGWSGVGQVGQSVFDKSSSKQSCELCGRPVVLFNTEDANNSNVPPYCVSCANQIKRYATMVAPTSATTATSSTKINKMLDILQNTRQHYPDDKTIIFSQFTSMLDLMEEPLQENGFKFCRYDGSMSNQAREKSLQVLRSDSDCRVMLISLKCGSLGLNLTAANRVILMDVWWNPAVEDQAIDRVHRIGQKLPVHVTRLLIDRTVEQKIIKLQQHKARIAKGALGDHMTSNSNLTTQELLSFFDL